MEFPDKIWPKKLAIVGFFFFCLKRRYPTVVLPNFVFSTYKIGGERGGGLGRKHVDKNDYRVGTVPNLD